MKGKLILVVLLSLLGFTGIAQNITVKGVVTDETGMGVPGVNVIQKESSNGTVTSLDGDYSLEVPKNAVLVFSFVGYQTVEEVVNGRSEINIQLSPNQQQVDEVVVTALGIKREIKALGYSASEIDNSDLIEARSSNFVNGMAGKISGLQVVGSSGGVASSSRITLRGESSMNLNKNQPLFVVDGIPLSNNLDGTGAGATTQTDLPVDFGNGASEINPDDIASVTVLKGANAAALYGSRAANGVVLITTKSGVGQQGLTVEFNSNTRFESFLKLPDYQNVYGGGWNGEYAGDWGYNWGPKMEGQLIAQHGSPEFPEASPFSARGNSLEDFFRTGVSLSNNLAITSGNDKGNFRISYTNLDKEGILPNNDLKRNTYSVSANYELTSKLRMSFSGNYVNSKSDNITVNGYGGNSIMYNFIWWYRNADINWFKNYWQEGMENVQQDYFYSWSDNPWLIVNENINSFNKDRVFGNISFTYQFNHELSLMVRSGTDFYHERRNSRRPWSTIQFPKGMYREQRYDFKENNYDFLLTYSKTLSDWNINMSLGGSLMEQEYNTYSIKGSELGIPGVYNVGNISDTPVTSQFDQEKEIQSLYGLAQINYKDKLFIDITGRNDWSSTLPDGNNSYFYPSVSVSGIVSSMLDLPSAISFLKLRGGIAQVGNDTDPYMLYNTYLYGKLPNSLVNGKTLLNKDLKPEISTSYELGFDLNLFNDRVGLDLTYYSIDSKDQIIRLPLSNTSGYESKLVNAGKVNNQGWEIGLNLNPIQTKGGFRWDVALNWTKNDSEVKELVEGMDNYIMAYALGGTLTPSGEGGTVEARVGEKMGDMYGYVFQRDPEGRIIYSEDGKAQLTTERKKIGNYNPDWMLGISNTFSYKGFTLGALFDVRQGGKIYSYTRATGSEGGALTHTLPGREGGIVPDGVYADGAGGYTEFTETVSAPTYYRYYYARSNIESNTFDASYVKLRELSLSYQLPQKLIKNTSLKDVRLSLVGRNLKLWTDVPNIDPETQAMNGGTLVPGFEVAQLPSTKSWGFNVNVKF